MACARAAICFANTGSHAAGLLKPWRRAFCAERALPAAVLGPRLLLPFLRLASRLASVTVRSVHLSCSLTRYLLVPFLFYQQIEVLAREIFPAKFSTCMQHTICPVSE
jgi:hypothetical protein